MTDTNQAPAKPAREKASERHWIDAAGNECDMDKATGIRYVIPANGRSLDVQFADVPPAMQVAGWGFGMHTKMGNIANTVRNDKANPGTPDDEADAVEEFLASYIGGVWREASEARGPKYDDDILADALLAMAHAKGLTDRTKDTYVTKLADKKTRAQFLAAGGVKDAYNKLAAERGVAPRPTKDVADLL